MGDNNVDFSRLKYTVTLQNGMTAHISSLERVESLAQLSPIVSMKEYVRQANKIQP